MKLDENPNSITIREDILVPLQRQGWKHVFAVLNSGNHQLALFLNVDKPDNIKMMIEEKDAKGGSFGCVVENLDAKTLRRWGEFFLEVFPVKGGNPR